MWKWCLLCWNMHRLLCTQRTCILTHTYIVYSSRYYSQLWCPRTHSWLLPSFRVEDTCVDFCSQSISLDGKVAELKKRVQQFTRSVCDLCAPRNIWSVSAESTNLIVQKIWTSSGKCLVSRLSKCSSLYFFQSRVHQT